MNCIFCCVFIQKEYVDMFLILLESIFIYGNLQSNTEILIYTSTTFMYMIKQHHLYNPEKIKFEINDTFDNINKACKARLDLFNLPSITNYNKILYLDTDIIVKDDINKVFNVCEEDILYVLEEGEINNDEGEINIYLDFWGKSLFGNEINNYKDKSAFTSGILLFNNCEKIKNLFSKINEDIIKRPFNFSSYEQPYIIYNAFKYNLYNNKILKSLVVNTDSNINSDKVIHHFPGNVGFYINKINLMTKFLNEIKLYTYLSFDETIHIETDIWTCSYKMRLDIANFFVSKKNYKIAEIGSHKGYSTKILSKIFSKVYAVDNSIEWTEFNKNFNKDATNIEYVNLNIYEDSWDILPGDIDVSFIDAVHSYECCKSDIYNSIKQFKNLQYIVFDDYGVWDGVKKIIDELIDNNILIFEKFIGLNDVPGPNGIVKDVNEGVICRVNKITNNIIYKTYTKGDLHITFLDNLKLNVSGIGEGSYKILDKQNIIAYINDIFFCISFNIDYTEIFPFNYYKLQVN